MDGKDENESEVDSLCLHSVLWCDIIVTFKKNLLSQFSKLPNLTYVVADPGFSSHVILTLDFRLFKVTLQNTLWRSANDLTLQSDKRIEENGEHGITWNSW